MVWIHLLQVDACMADEGGRRKWLMGLVKGVVMNIHGGLISTYTLSLFLPLLASLLPFYLSIKIISSDKWIERAGISVPQPQI